MRCSAWSISTRTRPEECRTRIVIGVPTWVTTLATSSVTREAPYLYVDESGRYNVFVPSARATSEDDGYLMGYVYDAATDTSDFVILDAHDFNAPAIATVHLPARVPYGFHGNWVVDPT